jgi:chromosome partitioning protein
VTAARATPAPRIIAIANQKGGVGKTTTAVNLATSLAACGQRVLLIDSDPQANASTGFGINLQTRVSGLYDVLIHGKRLAAMAEKTSIPNLFVVPATVDLAGAEVELADFEDREYRLRDAVTDTLSRYRFVLIDCPPSLNFLTLNALVAADSVLIPVQCEYYALEGLSQLMRTIDHVRQKLNRELEIQGLLLTMYDRRNKLAKAVEADVRAHFGDKVYDTVIPRNVRVSEAPSHGVPVILYDLQSVGAQAYLQLAREVLRRERTIIAEEATA